MTTQVDGENMKKKNEWKWKISVKKRRGKE